MRDVSLVMLNKIQQDFAVIGYNRWKAAARSRCMPLTLTL